MANEPVYYMNLGFQLGILVAKMVCGTDLVDRSDEVFDCLDGIARGELTPIDSDSELTRKFPDARNIGRARRHRQEVLQTAAMAVLFAVDKLAGEEEEEDENGDEHEG